MAEHEHEQDLYGDELGMGGNMDDGQEIPVGSNGEDAQMGGQQAAGDDQQKAEIEAMKARLKEMEDEAARLRASQQQGASTPGGPSDANAPPSEEAKAEADSRSIYVGSVDYSCTPEELAQHFQSCGTVNRVTILTDKGGNPKGFAYVEFLEVDAVSNAAMLDSSELRGRKIKVSPKRTNVPGLKARGRGRGRGSPYGRGGGYFMPYPPMAYAPMPYGPPMMRGGYGGYGYGYAPRGRGRGRGYYSPY